MATTWWAAAGERPGSWPGFDNVRDYALGLMGDDVIYVSGNDEADGGEGDDRIFATYPSPGA